MGKQGLVAVWALSFALATICGGGTDVLPVGSAPPALEFQHFPDRLHTFVWRNWELVSLERMADVLGTTPENVRALGTSLGLPPYGPPPPEYLQRGYISLIRRNWHLLPYEQLLKLLGWDAEKLAFTLKEDDFLWIKLGSLKPSCPPLRYEEPTDTALRRCAEIRAVVASHFQDDLAKPGRPRFDFIRDLSTPADGWTPSTPARTGRNKIRFLYSYFATFGDPLLAPELDPYPDGLLQRLSDVGVNGVWLHVVLRQLAPGTLFAGSGTDPEKRIANLRALVNRAKKYGIDVYLYMNEPRAMEASFFHGREDLKGVQEGDFCTLCTSTPQVRRWLTESLRSVFEQVPGLGGAFTITASENLTNCYSHSRTAAGCPRCSKRSAAEVIAEVNAAIAAGVRAGNPQAKVIVWDWGWPEPAEPIINALPDDVYLMSVSEWDKPIVRGGVASNVGEYSLSAVGPGPRALRHWAIAKKRGLKTIAKVQVNCTWELSAVPYLPVMDLIAEHCRNLSQTDIDGLMLSWSVGGHPSPNLQLVRQFDREPVPMMQEALARVAETRYGPRAAGDVRAAWSRLSTALTEFPFHVGLLYQGPLQWGPANPLYAEPTRYRATMVGFPYDDLASWRAIYPPEVFAGQFEKLAAEWGAGLSLYRQALGKTGSRSQQVNLRSDLNVTEAAYLHFRSVANQIRFIMVRDALLSSSPQGEARAAKVNTIKEIASDEIENARRLFILTREDSRIGFEASNHYYYLPLDLVEKVVNCEYVLNTWLPSLSSGSVQP
jgi:hypothetical protein